MFYRKYSIKIANLEFKSYLIPYVYFWEHRSPKNPENDVVSNAHQRPATWLQYPNPAIYNLYK